MDWDPIKQLVSMKNEHYENNFLIYYFLSFKFFLLYFSFFILIFYFLFFILQCPVFFSIFHFCFSFLFLFFEPFFILVLTEENDICVKTPIADETISKNTFFRKKSLSYIEY
jgi:hypothetical protein